MLQSITYALLSAWTFTLLLALARSIPRREDGRPAAISTAGALLLISWAGGLWARPVLGFDSPHPLPYAIAALLGALALATFSVPVRRRRPRGPGGQQAPARLATLPSAGLWALMVVLAVAIVARYALGID